MGRAEAIARDATPREWARRGARWVGPYLKLRRPAVAAVLLPGCATGYRSSGQRAASSRKLLLLEFCHWCLRRGRILSCICPLLRGRRHRRGGRHGVLAPVPHGGARSLQHVPWPATAPVSAFCPHPLARPGADARCATHRCFPRRSAGAAGARSGGENSPRFEDDDTVHTERHFVPGKSQGRARRQQIRQIHFVLALYQQQITRTQSWRRGSVPAAAAEYRGAAGGIDRCPANSFASTARSTTVDRRAVCAGSHGCVPRPPARPCSSTRAPTPTRKAAGLTADGQIKRTSVPPKARWAESGVGGSVLHRACLVGGIDVYWRGAYRLAPWCC